MTEPRRLLISVDNSDACEEAVKWVMKNVYKPGDELVRGLRRAGLCADRSASSADIP
jgi:hypothetical protein